MDADEDVSARILLRNVLHTEPPRTPATRGAARAQPSAKPSTLRRSGRLRRSGTGAPTPTDALRRSMKQRLHESTSSMFPSLSKRRTVSARVRKTDTPASDSLLNDDATPRHLLKGILQTEAETSMVQSQTVWREPEVPPPADSSLNRNRPSSGMSDLELPTNLSDLDLPNMSTINLGDSGKGLSRKRPRRSLNITEFRRGVERRLQQANEEEKEGGDSADDLSGLSTSSLDSVTLSLKTPAVDVQTEKRGLRRRLPGRREIVGLDKKVEDFCAAVQNRLGEGHPEPGDITEHDITSDIIVGSQDLYARSVAMGDTISVTATREEGKEKEEEMELSGEAGQGESSVRPIQVEEENMLEPQTEEDGAEIQTEEEELAKIQTEGDEGAESQTDEEREEIQIEEGAETQTEDEEVPETQTEEEEIAESQTEDEEVAEAQIEEEGAETQSNEEEEIAETQTNEEEGVAETQTEEGAEFQTDEEEMAGTQTDKEEGEESEMDQEVAATLREEEEEEAESQTEEEEVAEPQTGEEEVAEPQTEEEEVAEPQTGEEEVAEPQTEEEEVALLLLSEEEEEVAESQTGDEEEVADPQTEGGGEEVAEPQTEEEEVADPQTEGGEEGAESQQLEEWEEEEEEEEDGSQYEESSMTMPAWVTERRQALPIAPLVTPTAARVSTGVAVVKPKKAKPPKQTGSAKKKPELPKSYVMSVFKHFAKTRVSADVYPVLKEIMNRYFDRLSDDLEAYAAHAKRTTIEVADVELLLRRQGFVTDAMPVNVLIEKYLPMEYRRLLIPCATGGNHVFPKQKK